MSPAYIKRARPIRMACACVVGMLHAYNIKHGAHYDCAPSDVAGPFLLSVRPIRNAYVFRSKVLFLRVARCKLHVMVAHLSDSKILNIQCMFHSYCLRSLSGGGERLIRIAYAMLTMRVLFS